KGRIFATELFGTLSKRFGQIRSGNERADAFGVLASAALDIKQASPQLYEEISRRFLSIVRQILLDKKQPGSLQSRVNLARILGVIEFRELENYGRQSAIVSAGPFVMGSGDPLAAREERPTHRVFVSNFWVCRFLVTNADFLQFITSGGYKNEKYW